MPLPAATDFEIDIILYKDGTKEIGRIRLLLPPEAAALPRDPIHPGYVLMVADAYHSSSIGRLGDQIAVIWDDSITSGYPDCEPFMLAVNLKNNNVSEMKLDDSMQNRKPLNDESFLGSLWLAKKHGLVDDQMEMKIREAFALEPDEILSRARKKAVRDAAVIMSQGLRSKDSNFSKISTDTTAKIAGFFANSDPKTEAQAGKLIDEHLKRKADLKR